MTGCFILFLFATSLGFELKIGHMTYTKWAREPQGPWAIDASLKIGAQQLQSDVNPDFNMSFVYKTHAKTDVHLAIREFYDLYKIQGVSAVLAPYPSEELEPVGKMAAAWDILLLAYEGFGERSTRRSEGVDREKIRKERVRAFSSYGTDANNAGDEQFGDKQLYSTLARFSIDTREMSHIMALAIRSYGWRRVAIIAGTHESDNRFRTVFKSAAETHDIDIVMDLHIQDLNSTHLQELLEKVRHKARIIICRFGNTIQHLGRLLEEAYIMNMTGTDYVYLMPWFKPRFEPMPWELGLKHSKEIKELFTRVLVVLPSGYFGDTFSGWLQTLTNVTEPLYNISLEQNYAQGINMATRRDAVYLYGLAVDACIKKPGCDFRSGRDMMAQIVNLTIVGASGKVHLDGNGDRHSDYNFLTYVDDKWVINVRNHGEEHGEHEVQELVQMAPLSWGTLDGGPPPDTPPCGFDGGHCLQSNQRKHIILSVIVLAVLFCIGVCLGVHFRNKRFEARLLAKVWQIDPTELTKLEYSSMYCVRSLVSLNSYNPLLQDNIGQEGLALWKGVTVRTNTLVIRTQFEIHNRSDLLLLKEMKELQYVNLNAFIGVVLMKDSMMIIWNYCQKESLDVIVHNEEIVMDNYFCSSILHDTIRGLNYLCISKLGCHGHLSIKKCLVDSRWTVRLTGFGLQRVLAPLVKAKTIQLPANMKLSQAELIETAPELLNHYDPELGELSMAGNIESDIYAFGMIMYQVLFRESPFALVNMSQDEIAANLRNPGIELLRPKIPEDHKFNTNLIQMMINCWSGMPAERPTIEGVRKCISDYLLAKTNLVDHAVGMMEKYSKNLEGMVESRTKELVEERQRADQLLNRMLPKFIADQLKQGVHVEPESFEAVTIMFTDIVGFTGLCARSTPLEVVGMMNHYYSHFDNLCEKFDVYKVETIGDAYMVASGLPLRNGTKHVTEIAQLALEHRQVVATCHIKHLHQEHFSIRFGIHTGSVAAGVVGFAMPHYCLFGDTVNIAARMESHGKPMKIHVSEQSRDLIEKSCWNHKFDLSPRGLIEIKGKGQVDTYFLEEKVDSEIRYKKHKK